MIYKDLETYFMAHKNNVDFQSISPNTKNRFIFLLPCGHEIFKSPKILLKTFPKCQECLSIASDSELVKMFNSDLSGIGAKQLSRGSHRETWWNCDRCGEAFRRETRKVVEGFSCLKCYGSTKESNRFINFYPEIALEWDYVKNKDKTPYNITVGHSSDVYLICKDYGHSWKTQVGNRVRGNGCPYCMNKRLLIGFNDVKTYCQNSKRDKIISEWSSVNEPIEQFIFNSGKKVYWHCLNCENDWFASISGRLNKGSNCPRCASKERGKILQDNALKRYGSILDFYPDLEREFSPLNVGSLENISVKSAKLLWWTCLSCGIDFQRKAYKKKIGIGCSNCFSKRSSGEIELVNYIKTIYGDEIIINDRAIISPYEIDVYLPNIGIAIEFNGDYWHSDEVTFKNKGVDSRTFNVEKLALCYEKSIDLIFVWENDWLQRNSDIKKELDLFILNKNRGSLLSKLSSEWGSEWKIF